MSGGTTPLSFARIVVIGGGCYGRWYTQQLTRAMQRGALVADEIVVVDRNPANQVAQALAEGAYADVPVRHVRDTWANYLAAWMSRGVEALTRDAMVPSPLMPHLCLDWLVARAQARWPERRVEVTPLTSPPDVPWERAAPDGRHYVSFATWTCPVNCIEPVKCPATRSVRDWSMPVAIQRYADRQPVLNGAAIFHCVHRTYGVGMIDVAAIAEADRQVAAWGVDGPVRVLVGTVSHCHGALGVLSVA